MGIAPRVEPMLTVLRLRDVDLARELFGEVSKGLMLVVRAKEPLRLFIVVKGMASEPVQSVVEGCRKPF